MMKVYGWLFLATGAVFVAAPAPLTALLGLPNGGPGLWLGLAGSLMGVISLLSFQIAEDPFVGSRWDLLLLSKAVSSLLFAAFAAARGEPGFLFGTAVDSAIFLHLVFLRAGVSRPYRSRAACSPASEAWFVMVQDIAARRGFWARYAVSRGRAECRAVLFDKAAGRAEAERWERPAGEVASGLATAYRLDGFSLAKGRAAGPSWDLTWPEAEVGLLSFAPPLLGGAGLVRGGYEAVEGLVRVTGEARVGALAARFAEAPAGVGHLWSPRGARGWRWARAVFPRPGGTTVFEILTADAPVLSRLSVPLTAARLMHEGRSYACVGVLASMRSRSALNDGAWTFRARLGAVVVEGDCRPDESLAVEFPYESPWGPGACRTSMTGSMRLTVKEDGRPPVELSSPEGAIVELAAPS